MPRELWINLPVKEVGRSRAFFAKVGFAFNEERSSADMACMVMGEKGVVVMLFPEAAFKGFVRTDVADPGQGTEVLFSIDAESRDEVDAMTRKAAAAGGTVFSEPQEAQGWMYGAGFADPDGHRWNILYMDHNKMDHSKVPGGQRR